MEMEIQPSVRMWYWGFNRNRSPEYCPAQCSMCMCVIQQFIWVEESAALVRVVAALNINIFVGVSTRSCGVRMIVTLDGVNIMLIVQIDTGRCAFVRVTIMVNCTSLIGGTPGSVYLYWVLLHTWFCGWEIGTGIISQKLQACFLILLAG